MYTQCTAKELDSEPGLNQKEAQPNSKLLLLPSPNNTEADPAMLGIKFLLLCLTEITIAASSVCYGKVMMEYIGATGVPVSFSGIPIDPKISFHFLLSFAIDANSKGVPQNGVFSPYWSPTITPSSVRSVKARHPNVKILASLSGWSIGDKVLQWYNPLDSEEWITNAVNSLQSLAVKYHLDGIDIDYEVFPRKDTTFTYCIGELITRLKTRRVITVATIAPYYDTAKYYVQLYQKYVSVIDYVNHQFYTDKVASPVGYLKDFKMRATQFSAGKLLPSYEVKGRGIQGDKFFEALRLIESSGYQVNGVMIFSADASKDNGYYFEKKSQAFLLRTP